MQSNLFNFNEYLRTNKLGSFSMLNENKEESIKNIISEYVKDPDEVESELNKYMSGGLDAVSDSLAANMSRDEDYATLEEHFEDDDTEFTAAENPHVGMNYSKSSNFGDAMMDTVEEDATSDVSSWVPNFAGKNIKGWTADYENQSGALSWTNPNFEDVLVSATPGWEGDDGVFVEIYLSEDEADSGIPAFNKTLFANNKMWHTPEGFTRLMFQLFGWIELQYLPKLRRDTKPKDADLEEDLQYDDNKDYSENTRIMDLGGDMIEQGIISLLDDGFSNEDILELVQKILLEQDMASDEWHSNTDGHITWNEIAER